MKIQNSMLVIRQLDKKFEGFVPLMNAMPRTGWINLIRKALKMSLRQLGNRMSISPQGVRDIENREEEGTITLKTLRDVANALDMNLVYGFIPKDGSLEKMIENRSQEIATQIVKRTSRTMKLEDQENSEKRILHAIAEMTEELKRERPRKLWD